MKAAIRIAMLALTTAGINFPAAAEKIAMQGAIEKLEGPVFVIRTRYGAPAKFTLGPSPHLIAVEKSSRERIKPGTIVEIVRNPNARNSIVELQIFSETSHELMKDVLDNRKDAGLVRDVTPSGDQYRLSLGDGAADKQIVVPIETPIVAFVPGEAGDVKVGSAVVGADGKKIQDGLVQIDLLVYGRDGAVPKL
jgi:hypothetical protein